MMGLSEQAKGPIDRALVIAKSVDDGLLKLQAGAHVGRLHHDRGEYRHAAEALRESLTACWARGPAVMTGTMSLVTQTTTYLAWTLAELGEFPEATQRA